LDDLPSGQAEKALYNEDGPRRHSISVLDSHQGEAMLLLLVLITLAAAPLGLMARPAPRPLIGWALALIPLSVFVTFAAQAPAVIAGQPVISALPWVPEMGIELRLSLDGLGLLFALLVSGIGALIVLYTAYYMAGDPGMGRFYLALFIFMGAMLGLVLSDNVLTLFVFWELTSISSYLLVGYKHDYAEARRGAQMGLLITVGGGLALMVGMVLLGSAAGSYTISEIVARGDVVKASPLYAPALLLIFLGCFTKSAQFPFHFWLPNAMQAPTPASAFLHSATMVKAGVFLLARLHPGLSGTPLWAYTLTAVGMVTMLVGSVVAMRKDDIKGLLAYSTVALLGTMVMLTGVGGPDAPAALAALILAHALYKGSLFMIAGAVDHEAGTRKLSELGGLRKEMPRTFALAALAALSMAGIPPLFGFVAKEEVLYAVTHSALPAWLGWTVVAATVVMAIYGVLYAWRFVRGVFLGAHGAGIRHHVHDAPLGMLVGPGVLTLLSLALPLGLLPAAETLLLPAVTAIAGPAAGAEISLHLIPTYVSLPLILSAVAIGTGIVLTRFEGRIVAAPSPLPRWLNGDTIYDAAIAGLLSGTTAFTRVVQGGKLRVYIAWSIGTLVAVVLPPLALYGLRGAAPPTWDDVTPYGLVAALLIPVGVLATINARSRLGAIIAVGIVGAMVAFQFVIYSAPDLALTQLLIEVLSTVFLVLVFAVLPSRFATLSRPAARFRDAIIAMVAGTMMAGVTYVAATSTQLPSISSAFRAEAYLEGNGANVVNVILVDFRGFDTMGEITVLFIALIGIYAMLRLRPSAEPAPIELPDGAQAGAAKRSPPPPPKPPVPEDELVGAGGKAVKR
jgi:multicomponent Na+:H+ antiporter subunit A